MILLLSRLRDDSTYRIAEWLFWMDKEFIRINHVSEFFKDFEYDLITGCFGFKDRKNRHIKSNRIRSWYFLGGGVSATIPPLKTENDPQLGIELGKFLNAQSHYALQHILDRFLKSDSIRCFGLSPFSATRINKLEVLKKAEETGFTIPDTALVTTKSSLNYYKTKWKRMINKSIDDGISIVTPNVSISGQETIEIDEEVMNAMDDSFFPSLVQRLIEKEYEIRVFYFKKQFSSMAIFSQSSTHSQIDGRQMNPEKITRHVPFLLPAGLRDKISMLMDSLNLNYGSIDMIKARDGKYYFLEVNPYGQFGYLSSFTNCHLEQKIADYL